MQIKLANGQMAEFPDNTPPEVIARVQAQYSSPSSEQKPDENLLQKIMRYGIKDPLVGFGNIGHGLINIPSKAVGLFSEDLGKSLAYRPGFDYSKAVLGQEPDIGDTLIQGVTEIAPAFALPEAGLGRIGEAVEAIPKVGKYLKTIAETAAPQAGYAAAVSDDSPVSSAAGATAGVAPFAVLAEFMKNASPMARLAALAAGVGLGGLGAREAAKAAGTGEVGSDIAGIVGATLASRGLKPKSVRMSEMLQGAELKDVMPRLQAAERLGLDYLTPAEASLNPTIARGEGRVGQSPEGSKLFYERGQERMASEERSIGDLLDTIYTPDLDAKVKQGYKHAYDVMLPGDLKPIFDNDPIIKRAMDKVDKNPAFQKALQDIPKHSIAYMDQVKNAIWDLEQAARRAGRDKEASIYGNTRRELVNELDLHSPDYPEARALSERKHIREQLEKAFDRKAMTGTNFYKAIENKQKYDQIMHGLRNVPEAQQKLSDMKLLFNDLMSPPTIKTAKGQEERHMFSERNPGEFAVNALKNMLGGQKYDKEMVDLITSKDWPQHFKRIQEMTDKQQKIAYFISLLGKGAGQVTALEIED